MHVLLNVYFLQSCMVLSVDGVMAVFSDVVATCLAILTPYFGYVMR